MTELTTTDSASFGPGENSPHALLYANGYLWVGLLTSPGKLIRINPSNLSDQTTITFPSGGTHNSLQDLLYIASTNRIYCCFSTGLNSIVISEVNPTDLTTQTVIQRTDAFNGQIQSITSDDTHLYCASNASNSVHRFLLSDWSFVSKIASGVSSLHAIRHNSSKLYCSSTSSPAQISRVDTGTFTVDDNQALDSGFNVSTDDMALTADHFWLGLEGGTGQGYVVRVAKTDLTSRSNIAVIPGSACFGVYSISGYVFSVHAGTPGRIARIDPTDLSVTQFVMGSGQDAINEAVVVGQSVYVTSFASPGQIHRLDLQDLLPSAAGGSLETFTLVLGPGPTRITITHRPVSMLKIENETGNDDVRLGGSGVSDTDYSLIVPAGPTNSKTLGALQTGLMNLNDLYLFGTENDIVHVSGVVA
jgi:hypothetical protein